MSNKIEVSVYCLAYNHEPIIRKCLDGIVIQKTNFRYEVIVHDDASTDNTASIIKEYAERFPDIIKPIYQTENQYSRGVKIVTTYIFPKCQGKYLAVCEGDDFWTDENKLQKQYDMMERNKDIVLCVHRAKQINLKTGVESLYPQAQRAEGYVSVEEAIFLGGGYFPTCSFFYRYPFKMLPNAHGYVTGDYLTIVSAAVYGKVYFMDECMATKTFLLPSSWAYRHQKDVSAYIRHLQELKLWMDEIDRSTDGCYVASIELRKLKLDFEIDRANDKYRNLLSEKYKPILRKLPIETQIATRVRAYFPKTCCLLKQTVVWLKSRKGGNRL